MRGLSRKRFRPPTLLLAAAGLLLSLASGAWAIPGSPVLNVTAEATNVATTGLSEVLGQLSVNAAPSCGTPDDLLCFVRDPATLVLQLTNVQMDNSPVTGITVCERINGNISCDAPGLLMTGAITATSSTISIGIKGGVDLAAGDSITVSGIRGRIAESVLITKNTEALGQVSIVPASAATFLNDIGVLARSAEPLSLLFDTVPEVPCEAGDAIPTVQIIEGYPAAFVDHGDPAERSFPGAPLLPRPLYGGNANTRVSIFVQGLVTGVQIHWPLTIVAQNSPAALDLVSQSPDGAQATYVYGTPSQGDSDQIAEIFAVRLNPSNFTFTGSGTLSGTVTFQSRIEPPPEPAGVRPRYNHPLQPQTPQPMFLLRRCAPSTGVTGTVQVSARVDGLQWSGPMLYQLTGAATFTGTHAPETVERLPVGEYTIQYLSQGPPGASFQSYSPTSTLSVSEGGTISFTLNFSGPTIATLELSSTPNVVCPTSDQQVGSFKLTNTTQDTQIIAGGTMFTLTFDRPIVAAPTVSGLGNITMEVAGASATFTIPGSVSLAPGNSITFTGPRLNLQDGTDGQTIRLMATFTPSGAIVLAANTVPLATVRTLGCSAPLFDPAQVTNGASFVSGAAAGAITTVFGRRLSNVSGVQGASAMPLPTQIAGTSVLVNGVAAPLFAVANVNGQEQINFQMPWEVADQPAVSIVIRNTIEPSQAVSVPLKRAHPGIFTVDGTAGAILHGADFALVNGDNPAAPGETVIVYCTGLGPVTAQPPTGAAAGSSPLSRTIFGTTVTIGGLPAAVVFSGLAPGYVGLYQLNVEIPAGVASGLQDVVLTTATPDGQFSSKAVKIAIR